MRLAPLCILLAACSEQALKSTTPDEHGFDSGETGCPFENCTDTDDTDIPVDTSPDTQDPDCDVASSAARSISVLEECTGTGSTTEVEDPYNLEIEYSYTSSQSGPVVKASVINLNDDNGDGSVDTSDVPDMVFTVYTANQLVALNGDYSGEIFTKSGWMGAGDIATADVDNDGEVEICGFSTSGRVQCADAAGNIEWTSSGSTSNGYPHITICDLDEDGTPEVIGDNQVVNGVTGATEFSVAASSSYSVPVCADLDQDGTKEFLLGQTVYDHNGTAEWVMGGRGISAMTAIVNADADDNAEIFLASDQLYLYEDDGTLIRTTALPTQNPGPPCAADFDGDGEVEVAVPSGTAFYMFDTDGTLLWQAAMQDNSGLAGCSGYDMDGDGIYEVLFADEVAVRLYDGPTGSVLYESHAHNSGTLFEYPVIADVDQDGSAEIIVAENLGALAGITVYGHAGDGWPAAGPTWATHDFSVTNIEADGAVPVSPEPGWLKYNVFRARPAVDDPSTADLLGTLVDLCVADCDSGPVKVSLAVKNQGAVDIDAGVPWAFYKNDDGVLTYVTGGLLPAIPSGMALDSFEIELTPADLGTMGFVISLDDDGTGVDASGECDATNNQVTWTDSVCP